MIDFGQKVPVSVLLATSPTVALICPFATNRPPSLGALAIAHSPKSGKWPYAQPIPEIYNFERGA